MVREIVKDTEKLSEKCKTVTPKHKAELTKLILDMRDTAAYYEDKMGQNLLCCSSWCIRR